MSALLVEALLMLHARLHKASGLKLLKIYDSGEKTLPQNTQFNFESAFALRLCRFLMYWLSSSTIQAKSKPASSYGASQNSAKKETSKIRR